MMYVYICIAIIVIILLLILLTYNKLVYLKNIVKEAFSTMDVYLKKRWDLVPNLVECVKGYAKHEQDTLEQVIALRNSSYDSMDDKDKIAKGNEIASQISKIMLLAESYPELKASENFLNLSKQLVSIENDIENSRKYYNGTVKNYNIAVLQFPNNIIASMFGFKQEKMFEASEDEKQNVQENNQSENTEKISINTYKQVEGKQDIYLLPLIKIGGKCICMKGSDIEEELENAKFAIKELGGQVEKVDKMILPDSDITRNIIIIKKMKTTPKKYPRKAGTPSKNPLINSGKVIS